MLWEILSIMAMIEDVELSDMFEFLSCVSKMVSKKIVFLDFAMSNERSTKKLFEVMSCKKSFLKQHLRCSALSSWSI